MYMYFLTTERLFQVQHRPSELLKKKKKIFRHLSTYHLVYDLKILHNFSNQRCILLNISTRGFRNSFEIRVSFQAVSVYAAETAPGAASAANVGRKNEKHGVP